MYCHWTLCAPSILFVVTNDSLLGDVLDCSYSDCQLQGGVECRVGSIGGAHSRHRPHAGKRWRCGRWCLDGTKETLAPLYLLLLPLPSVRLLQLFLALPFPSRWSRQARWINCWVRVLLHSAPKQYKCYDTIGYSQFKSTDHPN